MESDNLLEKILKRLFIVFILLNVLIWSTLPLIREILPIDALECIYWGSLSDFGTNKHSPLAAWLAFFTYNLFKTDFSIYLLGQLSIFLSFIYIYKLGKIFLGTTKSILAAFIMEACFAYTYMGIYDGFNPNFLLLFFLPAISYYFYKSINEKRISNWLLLGVFVGLSFLSKYQTIILFIPLFIFLLITKNGREQFKEKGFYIAAAVAFVIFLPHLIWLIKNDFFSLNYFLICEEKYSDFYHGPLKYIYSPLVFLLNQLFAIAGVLFIYFSSLVFSKEKISQNINLKHDDKLFLIFVGIVPLILQALQGLNGNYMIPQWGYSLLFMCGILLFAFFPFNITERTIKYMVSWSFGAMIIAFIVLSIIFSTEKNFANRFPVEQVTTTLNNIYKTNTGKDIKYLGGFIELTIPLHIYNNKYNVILDTYGYDNIWINEKDLRESGALIIGRNPAYMEEYIESSTPHLINKPEVKQFSFDVKSAVGRQRTYNMYYAIVPANAEYKE